MATQELILPEQHPNLAKRFRGYLPIVIDIETGGFDPKEHAILEIAIVTLTMNSDGLLKRDKTYFHHVIPHPKTSITKESLEFTGIDPDHPFRFALPEIDALRDLFSIIRQHVKHANCTRAIIVAHNATFDMSFLQAAAERHQLKNTPYHPFSMIDTASLSAVFLGQTVLARATKAAGLEFDPENAHSAIYDAEITADLFCRITNQWHLREGWDLDTNAPIIHPDPTTTVPTARD